MDNMLKIGQRVSALMRAINNNIEQAEMPVSVDSGAEKRTVPVIRLQSIIREINALNDTLGKINENYLMDHAE